MGSIETSVTKTKDQEIQGKKAAEKFQFTRDFMKVKRKIQREGEDKIAEDRFVPKCGSLSVAGTNRHVTKPPAKGKMEQSFLQL